jgi:hypothetical protein
MRGSECRLQLHAASVSHSEQLHRTPVRAMLET